MVNEYEYEDRRHALEAEYVAALELLREGFQKKLSELEKLRSKPAEGVAPSEAAAPAAVPKPPSAPVLESPPAAQSFVRRKGSALPPRRHRWSAPEVELDLLRAMPDLPETFENSDIFRVLGYRPSRGTLARAVARLIESENIVLQAEARGPHSNVYHRTISDAGLQFLREERREADSVAMPADSAAKSSSDQP